MCRLKVVKILKEIDFNSLILCILPKIITKDSNINVVALAGKCVTGLAQGLRKKFQTYSALLIPAVLGKFKEKKLNVVLSLRDAIDAAYSTVSNMVIQVITYFNG